MFVCLPELSNGVETLRFSTPGESSPRTTRAREDVVAHMQDSPHGTPRIALLALEVPSPLGHGVQPFVNGNGVDEQALVAGNLALRYAGHEGAAIRDPALGICRRADRPPRRANSPASASLGAIPPPRSRQARRVVGSPGDQKLLDARRMAPGIQLGSRQRRVFDVESQVTLATCSKRARTAFYVGKYGTPMRNSDS